MGRGFSSLGGDRPLKGLWCGPFSCLGPSARIERGKWAADMLSQG